MLANKERVRRSLEKLLAAVDVRIDGDRPFDVRVTNDAFFERALAGGFTGIRNAYVDGLWEAERLDELTYRVMSRGVTLPYADRLSLAWAAAIARLQNLQNKTRSLEIRRHYDLGDDLFRAMLDKRMVYSCAYWPDAANLDEAQEAKLDLVCRKLNLRRGMRVLDIGCGWGSFIKFAAERYGVTAVGITLSLDQARLGAEMCRGLPVEIKVQDYRDLARGAERYDAVVSIGMFEHVGYKNYPAFMRIARACLKPDGLFLLHTIGGNLSQVSFDRWMSENIFPNAMLPSIKQIASAAEGVFVMEDWHNFGVHYDKTLMAWYDNFNRTWPTLKDKYGERFYRVWKCYLLTCAGSFRARENQLWQIVFSPSGAAGGYTSIR
ncbi:MAG: cyclopropane fatty acyl phospholipid synthase [Sulfurifustaceae bacterium]